MNLSSLFPIAAAALAMQSAPGPDTAAVARQVDAMYPKLEAIYKDLHAHPDLAFHATGTAAKLAAEMRAIGFQVTEKVGTTGLVAIYRNGAGPTVLVCTELDGLAERDVHMASWLGAARTLVALNPRWNGTLMFIAQPAAEIGSGAKPVLADGLLIGFPKPDYAFALNSWRLAYEPSIKTATEAMSIAVLNVMARR